jgi:PAS domain S-box-containing protein
MTQLNSQHSSLRATYVEPYSFNLDEDDRYQSLVENLSIGIVVHEASTRILFANSTACKMLGLCKDVVEKSYASDPQWQFIEEDGSPMRLERFPVNQVITTKSRMPSLVIGIQHSEHKGTTWVFCDAYPVLDLNEQIFQIIVNFTDITERIYLEKELIKAKTAKSRFIDIAAHELKNPIASLSAQVELTMRRLTKGQAVDMKTMEKIQRQTNRVSKLVVSLLDVSRLEKNTIKLKKQKVDVVALLQDCIQDFQLSYPQSQVKLTYNETNQVIMELDQDRLFQVITNLLDNANKYSEQKPIVAALSYDSDKITISVSDRGQEIPAKIREEIFKPFIRGDDKLKSSTPGLGLGLFISRSIVELHGGKITQSRSRNHENIFSVELPRGQL